MNHVDKYYWIINHPKLTLGRGQAQIELTPHMVNPITGAIDPDDHLNTKFEWWVELSSVGCGDNGGHEMYHEWELDCGGDTAEEAIDNLYNLVLVKYGDYNV